MSELTHIDHEGNAVMVDVSAKEITDRSAIASGRIKLSEECYKSVEEHRIKKGDVLTVAQIAGIMGSKKTSELIPLCHIIELTNAKLEFTMIEESFEIEAVCTVRCTGKTGAEMEALTGVSVGLLTVYDMCKAIDKTMVMSDIHLVEKSGGKSGHFHYPTV